MKRQVVILGAGHAGVQAAASLRDEGFDGDIRLIDAQTALPYQRPPLSKAFLKDETTAERLILRAEQFYTEHRIDLLLGESATAIEPALRRVMLASGATLAYDALILATGARARPFPVEGHDLAGVLSLRDLADAEALQAHMAKAQRIIVIGAGFIGLECAATAALRGAHVTVVEMQERVMARAISPAMSAAFEAKHRSLGATLLFGTGVRALIGAAGHVVEVELSDGRRLRADLVLLGIGVLAEDRLATAAGLGVDNGIVVDAHLASSDPAIFAIGDNNSHPNAFFGGRLRLESVQNALDQAKCLARNLTGKPEVYRAVPWFWSDQADFKLQIAGVSKGTDRHVIRGDQSGGAFSVLGFEGERLAVVESLNRPADHMIARRLIAEGRGPTPAEAADPAFDLRALVSSRT
jgi:3-phenylpropionate/trans-cinnamate dioxygenase ferredoxin reductase component